MGRRSGDPDQKVVSEVARAGMRRRAAAYKARQKGKPKSEKHREGNRRRNAQWKKDNPERVAELDREKALRSYHKNHDANKKRQRVAKKKAWDAMSPRQRRDFNLRRVYGISIEDVEVRLLAQGSACAGCGTDNPGGRGWQVDHCHTKKHIRGILCTKCNTGLGLADDRIETLERWIRYLQNN